MASIGAELYADNAEAIDRVIAGVCRRHGLFGSDADDFGSIARLHLIEEDYAVLRRFGGRSSLSTYLTVVVARQFQDWRNSRWGKWRPSAEARRLGPLAVRLETLTVRDGLTVDQAYEIMRTQGDTPPSRQALEALATRFPIRHRRSFVDDAPLDVLPSGLPDPEQEVLGREADTDLREAVAQLTAAVAQLSAQDRLILKMRFEDNCQIAHIARALRLEAGPLYRRIEKMLSTLRRRLEDSGLTAATIAGVLAQRGMHIGSDTEISVDVRPIHRRVGSPLVTGGQHD